MLVMYHRFIDFIVIINIHIFFMSNYNIHNEFNLRLRDYISTVVYILLFSFCTFVLVYVTILDTQTLH